MAENGKILYCNCAHAKVVPDEVKEAVLDGLCESGLEWQAVSDLCEMVARRDPALRQLHGGGPLKVAACYPRAVKWLFGSAGVPLDPAQTQICNMREESAEQVLSQLTHLELTPNVPEGAGKAPREIVDEAEDSR
ncbi:MAG: hypothetical protein LR011_07005 [Verrucomicrobia bacterium]|nr:hypothetical protein [Verrucomicrobiota bacterium]